MIHNILDTSVLMENPHVFNSLEDMIIIPIDVIKELDNNKTRSDLGGKNAREAIRIISKYISGQSAAQNKSDNTFELVISHKEFKNTSPDDSVIKTALSYKAKNKIVVLHSNDLALRLKAIAKGLNVSEILKPTQLDIYTGMSEIEVSSGFINDLYQTSEVLIPKEMEGKFQPNEFVVLRSGKQSAITKYKNKKFIKIQQHKKIFGIEPRSKEQEFAMDLLLDHSIELVSLIGKAGTGKSLLTLAAGLYQTLETGLYDKMIVIKPIISVGKEMGFLPGPQPLDAKVLTPTGWTTMGELKIGDLVIARNGNPTKVLNIFPKGVKPVYEIKTDDNKKTQCCLDHLWFTKTKENKKRNKEGSIKTTKEILDTLINKKGEYNHYLPRNSAVEFESKNFKLSPYVLGVFLGDGYISTKNNSIGVSNTDNELLERFNNEIHVLECSLKHNKNTFQYNIITNNLFNNKTAKKVKITNLNNGIEKTYESIGLALKEIPLKRGCLHYRCLNKNIVNNIKYEFIEKDKKWMNPVKEELYKLNLLQKKSYEKFIPDCYKYNSSIKDRISLLQGLMDTDGTIKINGEASFTTTSKQLALDIIEIVNSLGGRAVLPKPRNRIGKKTFINKRIIESKRVSYEFTISLPNDINPFYISRKASRHNSNYIYDSKIKSIEYLSDKKVQCILIEDPEHLYITDDYIVTHNTIEEKMEPWVQPIKDNLMLLFSNKKQLVDKMLEDGTIEIEPLSFIRGRSIPRSFIMIDESQNLSLHELKTIITRASEGSKIILCGDVNQIDNHNIDLFTNGLSQVIDKFKKYDLSGHMTLMKGQRSNLSSIASEIL